MGRVRQFILDAAAPLRCIDRAFLQAHLEQREAALLLQLRRAEVLHVIAVARTVQRHLPPTLSGAEARAVIRAALLHDIGKIRYRAGVFEKSVCVLAARFSSPPGRIRRSKAWDVYLNHPEYSRQILQALGSFSDHPYLLEVIRHHHHPEHFTSPDQLHHRILGILRQADEAH